MSHYYLLINELEEREQNNNFVKDGSEEEEGTWREGGFYLGDLTDQRGSHITLADLDGLTTPSQNQGSPRGITKSGTIRKLNRRHTFNDGEMGGERPRMGIGEGVRSPGSDAEGVKERANRVRRMKSQPQRSQSTASGLLGIKKAELSQSELLDRFKKVITAAVDFVIFAG